MRRLITLLGLLAYLSCASSAHASIAFVQQKFDVTCGGGSCGSKAVTLTSSVGAGHFIGVLANYCNNGGCTLVSPVAVGITDDHMDSYSCPVDDDDSTSSHAVICYAYNVAGGSTTVTIAPTGMGSMNYLRIWVVEFSGVATAFDPYDQMRGQSVGGSGTTTVATTSSPTQMAGELMLSLSDNFFGTVVSVNSPAVMLAPNTGTQIVPQTAYLITGAIGVASTTFNLDGSTSTRHYVLAMFCPPTRCGVPAGTNHASQQY